MKNGVAHRSNGETDFHGHGGVKAGTRLQPDGKWSHSFADTLGQKSSGNSPQMWKDREGGHFDGSYGLKTAGNANQRDGYSHTRHLTNQAESDAVKNETGNKGNWLERDANGKRILKGQRATSSKSNARKAASAAIAMIPPTLARHMRRSSSHKT